MPRVTRATKIESGDDGYVLTELISIEPAEDSKYGEQYEWIFIAPNSAGKNSPIRQWTGIQVNNEKTWYPDESSKGEYSKLVQILLRLNVIDEELLHSKTDIDIELNDLIGKKFRFKMIPDKKRPGLKRIDLKTIELAN